VKKVGWTPRAKADVRALDAKTAMRVLEGLARFLRTNQGDVKRLEDVDPPEFRLRVGDYRLRFYDRVDTVEILSVKHRSDAYR
jgi:mRNA-degrading endonuclease RelE of RelBE toxin-antitoxin system